MSIGTAVSLSKPLLGSKTASILFLVAQPLPVRAVWVPFGHRRDGTRGASLFLHRTLPPLHL